ncbi:hypothetical protein Dsin_027444 [Dipteronia sinensis]|uniref:Uncharacterized protein n=1 Tax=Dipteronia sinensis TaxID=43782 RepID=A0AAE0DTB0_9ROSI|nr:hypothetical protein Dsin_027444 [Dipteronia sinensis]
MSPSAKRPHAEDQSTVKLSVKSQLSKEMFFTIRRHVPLRKLLIITAGKQIWNTGLYISCMRGIAFLIAKPLLNLEWRMEIQLMS